MQARFFCNAMPWVDCTAVRYHCTKMPDVDLCPDAYAEGRFPPGATAKDFIRIEAGKRPVSALLLLPALPVLVHRAQECGQAMGCSMCSPCADVGCMLTDAVTIWNRMMPCYLPLPDRRDLTIAPGIES